MLVNRLNTVKMSVFPNLIYSHLNQKQNPRRSLMDTGKQLLKVIWSGAIKPTNANSRAANAAPTGTSKGEEPRPADVEAS